MALQRFLCATCIIVQRQIVEEEASGIVSRFFDVGYVYLNNHTRSLQNCIRNYATCMCTGVLTCTSSL